MQRPRLHVLRRCFRHFDSKKAYRFIPRQIRSSRKEKKNCRTCLCLHMKCLLATSRATLFSFHDRQLFQVEKGDAKIVVETVL